MRIKDAVRALQPGREKSRVPVLQETVWDGEIYGRRGAEDAYAEAAGEADAAAVPLAEYPRPQLVRENWINLNGPWRYQIVQAGAAFEKADGTIRVPFSPESSLSGVNRTLLPGQAIWYVREAELAAIPPGKRLLLHFGAVDERCKVWWNGRYVGMHRGGFLSFSFDVTEYACEGRNELRVYVRDDSDQGTAVRGKQRLEPGGMYYQAQSGIWQTVWLETVPENYLTDLQIEAEPEMDEAQVRFRMKSPVPVRIRTAESEYRFGKESFALTGAPSASGRGVDAHSAGSGIGNLQTYQFEAHIPIRGLHLWSPEEPVLHPLTIQAGEDLAESYFAVRAFGTGVDENGHPCLTLNGKPYFFHGILDQGYWPGSLMTPPSDEALVWDITQAKRLGFNTIRKHEKIECARWYYHCDRLGMAVWQDMPHGGERVNALLQTYLPTVAPFLWNRTEDRHYRLFGRKDVRERKRFERDLLGMIRQLRVFPCIALWGIFNEGWGQFDALRLAGMVKKEDPGRLVEHASGWFDQGGGDIVSEHNYFRRLRVKQDAASGGRPYVLSEYGGYTCRIPGHVMYRSSYGYHDYSPEELPKAFARLMKEIEELKKEGLAGAVYTQLSDIEEETNGLMTYDRRVCKLDV